MKKIFTLFSIIFLSVVTAYAQPIKTATYNTYVRLAEEQLELYEYYNALENYMKAYEMRKDAEMAILIADLNYKLRDIKKASSYYSRALRKNDKGQYNEYYFPYGQTQKMQGDYAESIESFNNYIKLGSDPVLKELAEVEIQGARFAGSLPVTDGMTIDNAGTKLNSRTSEYSPYLAGDGSTMYYTGFGVDDFIVLDGKGETNTTSQVLTSTLTEKGWQKPEALPESINRPDFHNSGVYIGPNGELMYITRSLIQGASVLESKIYVSSKTDEGWGAVEELEGIHGNYLVKDPAVGELYGNEVLFFTSDMDGGIGGFDIYYATKKSNKVYAEPVNLGPTVNSVGDEITPFYKEGSLYFSSNGHPSIGGYDIFSSEWDGNGWSKPTNMGQGFNTPLDDKGFKLDNEGYKGALVSNREGTRSIKSKTCCDDIWYLTLKKIVAEINILAFDTKTSDALQGVTSQLMTSDGVIIETKSNSTGNNFSFPLELDTDYKVVATAENYESDTITFNTFNLQDSKTYSEKVNLVPIPISVTITREEPIELGNILYDFNSAVIRPDAHSDLDFVEGLLRQYPNMVIELSSHTDNRGKDNYNLSLSQRRADSAKAYLTGKGITSERVVAIGNGENSPRTITPKIASAYSFLPEGTVLTEDYINSLPEGDIQEIAHQLNRRTEFKIISGPTSIKIEETKLIQIGNKKLDKAIENKKMMDKDKGSDGSTYIKPVQVDPTTVNISKRSSLFGRKSIKGVPLMIFKTRDINLGDVRKGEKPTGTFHFTNKGDTDLTIDIVDACDCTLVKAPEGKVFRPGESGQIDFTFLSEKKEINESVSLNILLRQETPGDLLPIVEEVNYTYNLIQ